VINKGKGKAQVLTGPQLALKKQEAIEKALKTAQTLKTKALAAEIKANQLIAEAGGQTSLSTSHLVIIPRIQLFIPLEARAQRMLAPAPAPLPLIPTSEPSTSP
jgi:hypothetical protein